MQLQTIVLGIDKLHLSKVSFRLGNLSDDFFC